MTRKKSRGEKAPSSQDPNPPNRNGTSRPLSRVKDAFHAVSETLQLSRIRRLLKSWLQKQN